VPVSQPTVAYLSYDDRNLYVAYICKDDRRLIRARVTTRDRILEDDRMSICIDTFHDHRHMYWFDINPYGVQMEGTVIDGVEDTSQWDTLGTPTRSSTRTAMSAWSQSLSEHPLSG